MNEEEKLNQGQNQREAEPEEEQGAPEEGQEEASAGTQPDSLPQGQEAGESNPSQQEEGGAEAPQGEAEEPEQGNYPPERGNAPQQAFQGQQEPPLNITQSQLNAIIQRRIAESSQRAMQEGYAKGQEDFRKNLYSKYGVDSDDALDQMFGDGERYGPLSDQLKESSSTNANLMAENAMLRAGILPTREEDVKAWAEHQGIQVTPETIAQGLQTHPEWVRDMSQTAPQAQRQAQGSAPISIAQFGGEPSNQQSSESAEEERARVLNDYFLK